MLRVPNPRDREIEKERGRERDRSDSTNSSRDGLTFAVPSFASKWYLSNLLDVKTDEDEEMGGETRMRGS